MTRVEQVVEGAARDARRPHRGLWAGLAVIIVALLATGWAVLTLYGSVEDNARAAQKLAEQVKDLGGVPVVQPPAPGQRGEQGEQGPPGPPGPPGRDGRDGTTPPCLSEPTQCRGATGERGVPGQNGVDGKDGQDGTNGVDGKDGRDGADGKPPSSWTWVDGAGRTQTCTRDASSPDTAPTYTCTAPSTGPPGTTTTTPPLRRLGG